MKKLSQNQKLENYLKSIPQGKRHIVIAKLEEIIGVNSLWCKYSGYYIFPKNMEGKKWEDRENI